MIKHQLIHHVYFYTLPTEICQLIIDEMFYLYVVDGVSRYCVGFDWQSYNENLTDEEKAENPFEDSPSFKLDAYFRSLFNRVDNFIVILDNAWNWPNES